MTRTFVLLLLCAVALLAALPPRATVTGRVVDERQAPVEGAAVSVVSDETGVRRSTYTDEAGDYGVGGLAPGFYKVTVRKPGFQTATQLHVPVGEGEPAAVGFTLAIGSIKQTITVESTATLANRDDGSVGTPVSRRLIEPLPLNGRGLLAVAELAPGVIATPAASGEAGQFTANGLRANANYFTVDGISANSGVAGGGLPAQFSGGTLPGMTAFGSLHALAAAESVEEVRIQTSSFAPEFGRLPGAQVMLTTRSGADEWRGAAGLALRNERANANSWFANRDGFARAPHRLTQGDASAGGPAAGAHWFAALESFGLTVPQQFRTPVPSRAARLAAAPALRPLLDAYPLPNIGGESGLLGEYAASETRQLRFTSFSLRMDRTLTPVHNFFARFHTAPSESEFGSLQVYRARFTHTSFTAGLTSTLRSTLVHDFRLNRTGDAAEARWVTSPIDLAQFFSPSEATWYAIAVGGLGGWISGQGGRNRQSQWSAVDAWSWTRGRHVWRFGAEYQRLLPSRDRRSTSLALQYSSLDSALTSPAPTPVYEAAERASSLIETLSAVVQDTWRARPDLTLVYGFRWEFAPAPVYRPSFETGGVEVLPSPTPGAPGGSSTSPPLSTQPFDPRSTGVATSPPFATAETGSDAFWPTRYGQFAPRIGAAWRRGPFVVRSGWGVFYDLGFAAATDPVNGSVFNRWQTVLAGGASPEAARGTGFAPGLRLPYSRQWNVSVDWTPTPAQVVTASAVGSAGRHLLRREAGPEPATAVVLVTNAGRSDYNGLQLQYRRRMTRRLQGVLSYSWSHAIDNGSWDSGIFLVEPGRDERASSSFDVRHSLTAAWSYLLPKRFEGWRLSAFARARSGFPIDVLERENDLGLAFDNAPRPWLAPGVPLWLDDAAAPGGRRLNPLAFAGDPKTSAPLPRNSIRGFGFGQIDLALDRHFPLLDGVAATIRIEAYNALNQASFADPVRALNSLYFGRSAGTLAQMLGRGSPHAGLTPAFQIGGPRTLQVQFRLRF
jgi:hypothetical protein